METCDLSSQKGCNAFSHCPANVTHFFRQHKSYHHLLFFVMRRVVWGVTSEQPLLCLLGEVWLQLGLDLPWPFVTSIPWKSLSATLRPDGETYLHSTCTPLSCLFSSNWTFSTLIVRGLWIQPVPGSGMRWAAESPSDPTKGWWEMLLHPLPGAWELNWNYPAIIHSSLGKVGENPFISMRTLKFFTQ